MATKRAASKSTKSKSETSGSAKKGRKLEAPLVQVDDPIIVKGGSVSLSFDQHNFEDNTSSPGDRNKKFDHAFQPPLTRLKIFRGGAIFFQTALNPTDGIMICYAGSSCPNVMP